MLWRYWFGAKDIPSQKAFEYLISDILVNAGEDCCPVNLNKNEFQPSLNFFEVHRRWYKPHIFSFLTRKDCLLQKHPCNSFSNSSAKTVIVRHLSRSWLHAITNEAVAVADLASSEGMSKFPDKMEINKAIKRQNTNSRLILPFEKYKQFYLVRMRWELGFLYLLELPFHQGY